MQKITPFLWFDDQAEPAANYYVSIFKDSKISSVQHYDDAVARASRFSGGDTRYYLFHWQR